MNMKVTKLDTEAANMIVYGNHCITFPIVTTAVALQGRLQENSPKANRCAHYCTQ